MADFSKLFFFIFFNLASASMFYGDGCEDLIKENKPYNCLKIDTYLFEPCYKPKKNIDGCVLDLDSELKVTLAKFMQFD